MRISVDLSSKVIKFIDVEAEKNKRTRKAQIEWSLENYAQKTDIVSKAFEKFGLKDIDKMVGMNDHSIDNTMKNLGIKKT